MKYIILRGLTLCFGKMSTTLWQIEVKHTGIWTCIGCQEDWQVVYQRFKHLLKFINAKEKLSSLFVLLLYLFIYSIISFFRCRLIETWMVCDCQPIQTGKYWSLMVVGFIRQQVFTSPAHSISASIMGVYNIIEGKLKCDLCGAFFYAHKYIKCQRQKSNSVPSNPMLHVNLWVR